MTEFDIETILALADNDMNIVRASKKMFVHQNTIVYRIAKIRKETGLNARTFYDLVKLVKMVEEGSLKND